MKKFIVKLMVFVLLFLLFIIGLDYLSTTERYRMPLARLTNSEEYISVNVGSDEIKPYIEKVKENNGYTQLIIGDSVCHQIFNGLQEYNSDVCIVGSNASITMAGQYILAKLFIENHPEATDIWLVVLPTSLKDGFSLKYGYQYVVMPFVETDTLKYLEDNTIEQLEDMYGKIFVKEDIVWLIDRSGINRKIYLNELSKKGSELHEEKAMADVSVDYICKIMELCLENDVKFHMLSGPMSEPYENNEFMIKFRQEYCESPLAELFPEYQEQIKYYPIEQFRDGTHFGGDYANQQIYNEKIWEIYGETGLMEFLCTE